jgi:heat shock protein HslJ
LIPTRRWLLAAALVAAAGCAAESGQAGLPAEMVGVTWQWVGVAGDPVMVDAPDRYTITFTPEGRAQVRADCNRGSGTYTPGTGGKLTLGPIALTRMGCPPGSLGDRYVRELSSVSGYAVRAGELELSGGAAALRFRRAA